MVIKKRVLVVDDHPLFREGLKNLVDRTADYQVVGEAGNGSHALRMARELRPDMATVDVSLPDMSGMEVVAQLTAQVPGMRVLMVSMHSRYENIAEALRAGALGYVLKDATGQKLVQALDTISRGEYFFDGNVSQEIVLRVIGGGEAESAEDSLYATLSPREQQVMRLAAEGSRTRDIAEKLGLSPKTVENHLTNLMKKLQVHNRMDLVRYAARIGVVDIANWK